MLTGPYSARTRALVHRHFENLVDETVGLIKPVTQLAVGPEAFAEFRQKAGDKAIELSHDTFSSPAFNAERAEAVNTIMLKRMQELTPEEFQNLLRPCFQEDEIKLIIIGGALGALAGLLQVLFVFQGRFW
jgi:hypothetical protein